MRTKQLASAPAALGSAAVLLLLLGAYPVHDATADTRQGKTTTVGGQFICDCSAPQDRSCSCILEAEP